MVTIARMIAESLYEKGVRTVFGLPGGEVVELLDALRQVGIEFVLVKNESSAVFMADITARLTGTIGVVVTTLGPGATNAYVGVAHAYLDRAPVLLISAQTNSQLIGSHTHQVLDLQASFRPVTKFTAELQTSTAIDTWRFALAQLEHGRPGPVHIGISDKVARSLVAAGPMGMEKEGARPSPQNLSDHVDTIEIYLKSVQKPVIVAGVGLEPEAPYQELMALADALDVPVIDTPKGKGLVSCNHPLFVGTIGLTRTDPAYDILDQADCILAIGFDVVELVKPWRQDAPLIWLASWGNEDPHIQAVHEYVGPLSPLLTALTDRHLANSRTNWGRTVVENYHTKQQHQPIPSAAAERVSPQEMLAIIRDNTPKDIAVTTDVGSHKIFTALNWKALTPNRYFLSNGLSAMGFGVPAALAAAMVLAEPVLCITGDGGLAMVVGELSLAIEYDLPVIIVVMNDSALDLIRSAQQRRGKPVHGTTFANPDYQLLALAYGLEYYFVDNIDSGAEAIQTAMAAKRPCIVDVQVDPSGYPTAVAK